MKKIQEQESKLARLSEDEKRKEEHLKKRKEAWEDKLKKKQEKVFQLHIHLIAYICDNYRKIC